MLHARLGVIERIRRVEHLLARSEQARIGATLMKGFSHELGNQVQIVKLAALELARRLQALERVDGRAVDGLDGVVMDGFAVEGFASPSLGVHAAALTTGFGTASIARAGPASSDGDRSPHKTGASGLRAHAASGLRSRAAAPPRIELEELITDMTTAADAATSVLAQMFAAARPSDRDVIGPLVSHAIRAAVDVVRPAIPSSLELRIELADTVQTYACAEELEALVLAAVLDASAANHITLVLRERVIQHKHWVELLRFDDRHHMPDGELAHMFEPHSLLHVVAGVAKAAGGDASLAPGRSGIELAVELPVAGAR